MDLEKLQESIDKLVDVSSATKESVDKVLKAYEAKTKETPETKDLDETDAPPALKKAIRKIEFEDERVGREIGDKSITKVFHTPPTKFHGPNADLFREFQEKSDDVYIMSTLMKTDPRNLKTWRDNFGPDSEFKKAMDSATATEGAEWIPTGFSAALFEQIRLDLKVASLHTRFFMPTDPYVLPVEGGDATAYKVTEQTGDTGQTKIPVSTPGTANVSLASVGNAARVLFSHYVSEDSIIPILDYVKGKISLALAEAEENAIINGDTTATHMDSDVSAASDVRKNWDGYRKLNQAAADLDLGTFNEANLRIIRAYMGKYGINPNKLAWVTGLLGYLRHFINLTNVQTVDKYGPSATILTGELGKFDGIPIIVSEFVREDLNASGVYDGVTTDNTVVELVHRPSMMIADRRNITMRVLTELYAESEQDAVIATRRLLFFTPLDESTEYIVAEGFNVDAA